VAETSDTTYLANNVIIAMASYQTPKSPSFADELDEEIVQLHVDDYANPDQLADGGVLVVGLGNSGAEVAYELVATRDVWVSGEPSAVQPFRPEKLSGRILMPIVGPLVMNKLLSTSTPMGRRLKKKMYHKAAPLMRVKPKDLVAAGARRVGRIVGATDGRPTVEDGTVLDVANVIWCTGYDPGFDWINLPIFSDEGAVRHERGLVPDQPGLYFVGLKFLYSVSSAQLHGVGRDAARIVGEVAKCANAELPIGATL
jgi:putative flavoprotein involved in K+ transport